MDWLDMQYFVTVVRDKSISKAARNLHISQPTLTARLKKLEAEFNVPLFERTWKGVELNEHGHQFLPYAVKVLEEFKSLNIKLNEFAPLCPVESEKLMLGVLRPLGPFFITPILQLLRDNYPNMKYDVISDSAGYLMELISIREIHLGIMPYFKPFPGLSSVPLFNEEICLLAPKNDPLRAKLGTNDWKSFMLSRPFYLYSDKLPFRKIFDLSISSLLGRLPDDIHQVNDTNTLLRLISNGFGYTVLPTSYIHDVFDLMQAVREPIGQEGFCISQEGIPYDIYYLPCFPKRTIYLVYPNNWDLELPLHQIVKEIASVYQSNWDYVTASI